MAEPIVPRWEWRTFGTGFGPAETQLADRTPTGVQDSEELYLLSADGDTVKVRDGLMDIKLLREVGHFGLERWEPVLKAGFPLDHEAVAAVFDALRQPLQALQQPSYELDEFLAELVDPHPGVRSVPVAKHRVRHVIEGCIGEISDVTIGPWLTRTVAIESEDADAVADAVRAVGLAARLNTSYPRGLAALFDGEPPRYATIDVGTNSVKLHVGQPAADAQWETVLDRAAGLLALQPHRHRRFRCLRLGWGHRSRDRLDRGRHAGLVRPEAHRQGQLTMATSDETAGEQLERSVRIDPSIGAVEVKITARVEDEDRVLGLLSRANEQPENRVVHFFDTPQLTLFEQGLVLRARKVDGDDDDSTVKLRPVDPATISRTWMQTDGFEIEMDRVGQVEVISAKLGQVQARGEIDEVVAGRRPLRKLFSAGQEQLVAEFGPTDVGWDDLVVMGPIQVRKWKVEWGDLGREVVVERWQLPDSSDLVELSVKVEPSQASQAAVDFLDLLEGFGLEVDDEQQTKTRGALRFFTTGTGFDAEA